MNPPLWVRLAVILLLLSCTSGCAVVMAVSGKKDPEVGGLSVGQDRAVVLALLGAPQKTYGTFGNRVDVFKLKRGDEPSPGRAVAHGVMDVLTLCLWEIVGTPIEATQGEVFFLSVQYDSEDQVARIIPGDDGSAMAYLSKQRVQGQAGTASTRPTETTSVPAEDAQAIAQSIVMQARPTAKRSPLQSLFRSPSKDYAFSARAIANDPYLSETEKLHALATLSAVHAASATDPQEKQTYARLNENFLKRAESMETVLTVEATAADKPGQANREPYGRQVAYLEEVAD